MYVNYVMNTSQHNGVPFVQYNYLGKQLANKYYVDQYNLYLNLLLDDLPWQADERRKEREGKDRHFYMGDSLYLYKYSKYKKANKHTNREWHECRIFIYFPIFDMPLRIEPCWIVPMFRVHVGGEKVSVNERVGWDCVALKCRLLQVWAREW